MTGNYIGEVGPLLSPRHIARTRIGPRNQKIAGIRSTAPYWNNAPGNFAGKNYPGSGSY
jgi:hypothetical protein